MQKMKKEISLYFIAAGNLPIFLFVSLVTTVVIVRVGFKQEQESLKKFTPVHF